MAYCNRCGAYIPDGQSKCLACGYDEAEEAAAAKAQTGAQSAAAGQTRTDTGYHFRNDDEIYRVQLEENRRRQQEQNRKWAEEEQQRRRAANEYQARTQNNRDTGSRGADFGNQSRPLAESGWGSGRIWSVLSYVSILCLIPLLTGRGGEQANFHAKQGVRLVVFGVVADALSGIPLVGWIFSVGRILLMIKGIVNAVNDRREPLPYIGNIGSF